VVFGWRALRPPRVVFGIGCVSCNTFSHLGKQRYPTNYRRERNLNRSSRKRSVGSLAARMPRAPHAGHFCLTSIRPAEFVTITSASRRHVASPGAPDFMLEHEEALPAKSQLAAPSPDSEAEAIQSRLLSLARRADVPPSQASILLSAHEFGVGSTINGRSAPRMP
jgi:hypothetical protein